MNIAVTGLNATDNPGPGVPVIRCIKDAPEFNGKIIGLSYDALEPGLYMEGIADSSYLIPYPSSGLNQLYERIAYIHEQEKLDLLIPTLDSELYGFVKLSGKLEAMGIKTYLPTTEQLNIRGKDKLFDFCSANEINMPKNKLLSSMQDLYSLKEDFEYPLVIKGIFYDAYIVNNFEEAASAFYKIKSKWGFPLIAQEYVRGDEFNVAALGDGTGRMTGAVAMRKLYITDKGKGWSGVTIRDNNLLELSEKVIEKTKWRSGMELEFIKKERTGEYYLLEINPRFPAWIYLAPAAGQNLPAALVTLAMGGSVPEFTDYKNGVIFVRSSWDIITDIGKYEKISTLGEI